jgi:hypothetical protein
MPALSLFAHLLADGRADPLMRSEVVWGVFGLTGAMLAGAAVIYAVDKWRKRAAAGPTDADVAASLTSFRDMYENGEISESEYADLRRRVAEKMKKPTAAAPPVAAPLHSVPLAPLPPPAGSPEPPPPPSTA